MKIITFILIFFCTNIFAQRIAILYVGAPISINRIQKDFMSEEREARKKDMVDSTRFTVSKDTIVEKIFDNKYGLTMKFAFSIDPSTNDSTCTYQEIIYDCSPCAQYYLKDYIDLFKFIETSSNHYIAKYPNMVEMQVHNTSEKNCIKLTFTEVALSKKDYKILYKSKKKK